MDIFIPGSDECDYSVQPHLNFQSQTAFCNMLQLFSCTFLCRDMYYIQLSSSLRQKGDEMEPKKIYTCKYTMKGTNESQKKERETQSNE